MDATPTSTSRRRVVQGLAWAAPAVAMTAAAPAFAASCTPTVRFSGGTGADFGNSTQTFSNQQVAFGGQVYVDNLPSGVTVTGVKEQYFVNNPNSGATHDGYWYPGNEYSNWYTNGQCTKVGCTMKWTSSIGKATLVDNTTAPGTGWSSTVTNTVNNQLTLYSDGVQRSAWDANLTWSPSPTNTGISKGANGCNNFTTGPSGKFGVNYINAPTKTPGYSVSVFTIVTVTLSKGGPLVYRTDTSTLVAPK